MKMDDEVPPPVPQVPIINYWSDSDDEIDQGEWAAYQRSLVKREVIEDELDLGDSLGFMFAEEVEDKKLENVLFWEDEFRGALECLLDYTKEGEFDLEGDLAFLESLHEGTYPM
ncbi:hypothetical protein Hanom_Chr11g01043771 [Helianthus anomalus]